MPNEIILNFLTLSWCPFCISIHLCKGTYENLFCAVFHSIDVLPLINILLLINGTLGCCHFFPYCKPHLSEMHAYEHVPFAVK